MMYNPKIKRRATYLTKRLKLTIVMREQQPSANLNIIDSM